MSDLIIGKGNLAGKGVYANRDFKKGEVVVKYNLKPLTEDEFKNLPDDEKEFTHTHWGTIYLYSEPERYVNHSENPNTYQDLKNKCDIALGDIKKGEMITTDATKDDVIKKLAVVYFPKTNLDKINILRKKYDPNWNIIPPHITLVFPLTDVPEDQLVKHLDEVVKDVKPFQIHLGSFNKSFDNYLFLLVKDGNEKIIALHDKLYSGLLSPLKQNDITFNPHITLGFFGMEEGFNKQLYEKAYKEAEEMNLDIVCNVDNISLIEGDELAPVKTIKKFNLG